MKILGSEVALRENLTYSIRRYRVWWVLLLVSMFFDGLTTLNFVSKVGLDAEANLAVRWLMETVGPWLGIVSGKLLQLLSVLVFVSLHRRLGNLFLLLVFILNCWAVVVNSLPFY